MAVYIVFITEKTLEPEGMAAYWAAIKLTLVGQPIRVLAACGAQETVEGPRTAGTVISEFPSMEAARAARYDGEAYLQAAKHRRAGAVYTGVLVQGVSAAANRATLEKRLGLVAPTQLSPESPVLIST